jgi:hypothetical protein
MIGACIIFAARIHEVIRLESLLSSMTGVQFGAGLCIFLRRSIISILPAGSHRVLLHEFQPCQQQAYGRIPDFQHKLKAMSIGCRQRFKLYLCLDHSCCIPGSPAKTADPTFVQQPKAMHAGNW